MKPKKASNLSTPEPAGDMVQTRQLRAARVKKMPTMMHKTIQMANKAPVNIAIGYSLVTFLFSK